LLSLLDTYTSLVTSPPLTGTTWLNVAPPLSSWQLRDESLHVTLAEPEGWVYKAGLVGPDGNSPVVDPNKQPKLLAPYVMSQSVDVSGNGRALEVSLAVRTTLIANGDFRAGPWQTNVGDCQAVHGGSASDLEATLVSGPDGLPALRLAASSDSACEAQNLAWHGGPLVAHLWIRHVAGSQPRTCFWEVGPNRCAPATIHVHGAPWQEVTSYIVPDAGTTSITLFLYSDTNPPARTLNDYADVAVFAVPSSNIVVIGYPNRLVSQASKRLLLLHESYSDDWAGPEGSRHVVVDGMTNGWLLGPADPATQPQYRPTPLISVGLWISGAVTACMLVITVALILRTQGWIRWRGPRRS
jgi:hypothetical protein